MADILLDTKEQVEGIIAVTTPANHVHSPSDVTGTAVVNNDARLTDARTPLSHSHAESDVTNLATDLGNKQATLVSATNIKTINGSSVLGSGDLTVAGAAAWGSVTGTLSAQTDLQTALDAKLGLHAKADTAGAADNAVTLATGADRTKLDGIASGANVGVVPNGGITGATKTKITYDAKGLVTSGTDATATDVGAEASGAVATHATLTTGVHGVGAGTIAKTSDITATAVGLGNVDNTSDANKPISSATQTALNGKANSLGVDDNYVTDAEKTVIGNTSGTNTGDNSTNTQYSGLISNATHTGDATGATALSVVKLQGKDFPTLGVGDDGKYPKYVNASSAFVMTAIAGGGDVLGPATNTDLYIPQWNGANSKTLKDGLAVPAGGLAGLTALNLKADASSVPTASASVTAETSYGAASNAGVATTFSKGDHTHGTPATTKDTTGVTGMLKGNGSVIAAGTDGTDFYSSAQAIPAANIPNGISTLNSTLFTQSMAAGTFYYVPLSALTMPAAAKTGGDMSTSTTMNWDFIIRKTAAGTAAFDVCIYRGVNGTTGDTRDVTQSIGTATAVVDIAHIIVNLKVTATGATGSYTWSISVMHKAATGAGFGTTDATPFFSGTVSSVAMNTASLKFGIGLMGTTGTTALVLSGLTGQVNNMD